MLGTAWGKPGVPLGVLPPSLDHVPAPIRRIGRCCRAGSCRPGHLRAPLTGGPVGRHWVGRAADGCSCSTARAACPRATPQKAGRVQRLQPPHQHSWAGSSQALGPGPQGQAAPQRLDLWLLSSAVSPGVP